MRIEVVRGVAGMAPHRRAYQALWERVGQPELLYSHLDYLGIVEPRLERRGPLLFLLVHGRATGPLTWATVIEVGGIVAALWLGIAGFNLVGVTAAAVAFILGRVAGNLYLIPPCARVLRGASAYNHGLPSIEEGPR